jgi:hypothetical protein
MTRDEHLTLSKARALEFVDAGDLVNAVSSLGSDLRKHEDTNSPALSGLVAIGLIYLVDGDREGVRRWIERFR